MFMTGPGNKMDDYSPDASQTRQTQIPNNTRVDLKSGTYILHMREIGQMLQHFITLMIVGMVIDFIIIYTSLENTVF